MKTGTQETTTVVGLDHPLAARMPLNARFAAAIGRTVALSEWLYTPGPHDIGCMVEADMYFPMPHIRSRPHPHFDWVMWGKAAGRWVGVPNYRERWKLAGREIERYGICLSHEQRDGHRLWHASEAPNGQARYLSTGPNPVEAAMLVIVEMAEAGVLADHRVRLRPLWRTW